MQLELNLLNARQAQTQAQINTKNATVDLQAHTGLAGAPVLVVPEPAPQPAMVPALTQARQHRSATLAFHRRLLQAERNVAQARGTTGFRATLTASAGYMNQAPTLGATYLNLQNQ